MLFELVTLTLCACKVIEAFDEGIVGAQELAGEQKSVKDLYKLFGSFKQQEDRKLFPDLSDPLELGLFNTYRWFRFPALFPGKLELHEDGRGTLFEAVKGGGGGQTFLSWTKPGVVRGNHFHKHKVERFLVVSGKARIKVREIFDSKVHSFDVTGEKPEFVDMPTLHTHSIENTGDVPVLTLFWAHEVFDPKAPDTYSHSVE